MNLVIYKNNTYVSYRNSSPKVGTIGKLITATVVGGNSEFMCQVDGGIIGEASGGVEPAFVIYL